MDYRLGLLLRERLERLGILDKEMYEECEELVKKFVVMGFGLADTAIVNASIYIVKKKHKTLSSEDLEKLNKNYDGQNDRSWMLFVDLIKD